MADTTTPTQLGFWALTWHHLQVILQFCAQHLVAPILAVVVVIGAILLAAFGLKELQVGGLLGKLLGNADPATKAIDIANTVPPNRIDPTGKVIPINTPDANGDTQVQVVPIQSPGLFSNPSTVTFTPPVTPANPNPTPVTVQLPTGVKNSDVQQVVLVSPTVVAVTVKDGSGIPASKIDDLLSKYGK